MHKSYQLINKDYGLVITHGNGPQIGNILLRNEAGYESPIKFLKCQLIFVWLIRKAELAI